MTYDANGYDAGVIINYMAIVMLAKWSQFIMMSEVYRGGEGCAEKPAALNFNMQKRLSLSIVHLISSVNYTAEMKQLFIRGPCRKKKRAVKLR